MSPRTHERGLAYRCQFLNHGAAKQLGLCKLIRIGAGNEVGYVAGGFEDIQ